MRSPPTRLARALTLVLVLALVLGSLAGCARGAPPAPPGIDASVAPLAGTAVATSSEDSGSRAPRGSEPADGGDRGVDAGETRDAGAAADGPDPGTLPQTRDKPPASSPAFEARAQALWEAIVHDDVERGMPFFFPVTAYQQVKDVGNPASDWRHRLVAAYKRDIAALHKKLGGKAESAKLARLEIPAGAKWVEPNEEYNKLGYYRVYNTRIIYELEGKERSLGTISSLISWRGEWYVVHLTGFK